MNKQDIYEHLAEIYLDASSGRKNKKKIRTQLYRNFFIVGIAFLFILTFIILISRPQKHNFHMTELALIITPEPIKINFHFDPAKKEVYTLNLNNLDLSKYKTLAFSLKKINFQDKVSLKVEFTTPFKEKSEIYLKDIPYRWKDYKFSLAEFQKISDWSSMQSLSFIVEEWNAKEKKDIIYIDNVRFLK
jgi:hypothetical protein